MDLDRLGPCLWVHRHVWAWQGRVYETHERHYLARLRSGPLRKETADAEARWWSIDELERTDELYSPRELPQLLRDLLEHAPPPAQIDVRP